MTKTARPATASSLHVTWWTLVVTLQLLTMRVAALRMTAVSPWARRTTTTTTGLRMTATDTGAVDRIAAAIAQRGDEIRKLKADKAPKEAIAPAVEDLLRLKKEYEAVTGKPFDPPKDDGAKPVKAAPAAAKPAAAAASAAEGGAAESLVITPRSVDYSAWYNDVISASDMVDQSPVRGCMVIKPWGMGVWDLLRAEVDQRIRDSGTQNAYFPLFIPKSFLAKEAEHVDGFAKECAVVTHHRLCASPDGKDLIPDPDAKLEEPLIVRPTSETVIWNMFGKWINSYRDLPLKINQWANVVRWEMRTRPFLRSAEFLWQEGHTAHATAADAVQTAVESLDMYASVCEDMLAMPTVKVRVWCGCVGGRAVRPSAGVVTAVASLPCRPLLTHIPFFIFTLRRGGKARRSASRAPTTRTPSRR